MQGDPQLQLHNSLPPLFCFVLLCFVCRKVFQRSLKCVKIFFFFSFSFSEEKVKPDIPGIEEARQQRTEGRMSSSTPRIKKNLE